MTFAEFTATRKHVDDVCTAIGVPGMFDEPQPGFVYDSIYFICDPCEATGNRYWTECLNQQPIGTLDEVERALYSWVADENGWGKDATPFADNYRAREAAAAAEQGVDRVIDELASRGINATLEQTGGMTMAFGIRVHGVYVQGNAWCAAAFLNDECIPEEMVTSICSYDEDDNLREGIAECIAEDVASWVARKIAKDFAGRLVAEIGDENYEEVVRRNATDEYTGCCASGDFCDSNMTMLAAFRDAGLDSIMTPFNDEQQRLWNRVWGMWRAGSLGKKGGAA